MLKAGTTAEDQSSIRVRHMHKEVEVMCITDVGTSTLYPIVIALTTTTCVINDLLYVTGDKHVNTYFYLLPEERPENGWHLSLRKV